MCSEYGLRGYMNWLFGLFLASFLPSFLPSLLPSFTHGLFVVGGIKRYIMTMTCLSVLAERKYWGIHNLETIGDRGVYVVFRKWGMGNGGSVLRGVWMVMVSFTAYFLRVCMHYILRVYNPPHLQASSLLSMYSFHAEN
ncbi:hypothetical protein P280DRAFT_166708 [Massarina eburnea CBS 473.64]|uniref:Uncharacterized protein n=1 Tax=Massarina eburnea CBS 473.64 TaxID=1395130 RepID=A0A6A6RKM5_9PLEO|nr:hypothetical protein P280DRAFT_166708 [Massarina eburnea CBS 473.64]